MPLSPKYSEIYHDALVALTTAKHPPAKVVNVAGGYDTRADFEYNRYVVATNAPHGLSDEPNSSGTWVIHFLQSDIDGASDELLTESTHPWLIDALEIAMGILAAEGNKMVADAVFGDISRSEVSDASPSTPESEFTCPPYKSDRLTAKATAMGTRRPITAARGPVSALLI